jgi:hypothetical protein
MNPIALGLIGIGASLLLFGMFSIGRRKMPAGIILSCLGLATIATPFAASYFPAR